MSNNKKIRMIIDNLHDTASLTATSAAMPITYTQQSGRAYMWRSTSTSQQVITAQLPSPQFIDAIVLYRHNLSAGARVQIELLDEAGDVVYDTQPVAIAEFVPAGIFRLGIDAWGAAYNEQIPVNLKAFWLPQTPISSYRITINDPLNELGYFEIGRIVTGLSFSPTYNPEYGLSLEWDESNIVHERTEGGSLRSLGQGISRRISLTLNRLTDNDRQKLTTELVKRGKSADVFISIYPEQGGLKEIEHSFLSRRENNFTPVRENINYWSTQLTFNEV